MAQPTLVEKRATEFIDLDNESDNTGGERGLTTPPPKLAPSTPVYSDCDIAGPAPATDAPDDMAANDAATYKIPEVEDASKSWHIDAPKNSNAIELINAEATKAIEHATSKGQRLADKAGDIELKPVLSKRQKSFAEALKELIETDGDMNAKGALAQKFNREMSAEEKASFHAMDKDDKKAYRKNGPVLNSPPSHWNNLTRRAGEGSTYSAAFT